MAKSRTGDVKGRQSDAEIQRQFDEALAELRASDEEWRKNDSEFRKMRRNKALPENDVAVAEFAEFVAALRRKMLESCYAFRTRGGDPDSLGIDCGLAEAKPPSEKGGDVVQDPKAARSEQEKTASLEGSFSQSLSEFDEAIQEKQESIRGRIAGQGPANGNVKGDGGKRGSGPSGMGIRSGGSASGSSGKSTDSKVNEAGAGPGGRTAGAASTRAAVAKGGSDDDVVARQLREAAEKEQDPVMKEKLWDEYRKYKASKN